MPDSPDSPAPPAPLAAPQAAHNTGHRPATYQDVLDAPPLTRSPRSSTASWS